MRGARRAWIINGVLVVALVAVGWVGYLLLSPSTSQSAATGVRTVAATTGNVVETVSAAGSIASGYTANADFGTSGTVTEIDVKVGDVVSKGQRLAKLDDTQARKQVTAAQASLAAAEENLANASTATTTTATSGTSGKTTTNTQQSTTALQAQVDQAELNLTTAQQALAATVLTAPGNGTVTAVNGTVGERAGGSGTTTAGTSGGGGSGGSGSGSSGSGGSGSSSGSSGSSGSGFIVITDLGNLVLRANIAEVDASKVKAGQSATVTVNALPNTPVQATVLSVDLTPTTSGNVVTFGTTLSLLQPPAALRPGQSASVAITVNKADNALTIPSAALHTAGGQNTVTVLQNGQEVTRRVEVGVRSESLVQVTSGLTEGDQVVLTTTTTGQTGGTSGQNGRTGGAGGGFFGGGGGGGNRGGGGAGFTGGGR